LPLPFRSDTLGLASKEGLALFHRIVRSALLFLALVALHPASLLAATPQPGRIVAVGDLHGDYDAWLRIARGAGLIDAKGRWAGGNTTLVQLGDLTDRQPDSLKIIRSLQQLQKQAPRKGGRVVVVLGNHEAMNLVGDNRYTTAGEYAAFADSRSAALRDRLYEANRAAIEAQARTQNPKITPDQIRAGWMLQHPLGWAEHMLAWSPNGELGRWATGNRAVVKIGDTVFVHGGLSAEYAPLGIDEINRRVAMAMAKADDGPASVLFDALGPLWYRGLVTRDPKADPEGAAAAAAAKTPRPTIEQEIAADLAATGARRMVIAHTPSLAGISITYGGRLIRIDTGISRFYGGPLSWLEIVGDQVLPHTVPRGP
jgi:hypothetical protein